jgi:hypothetical protein
MALLPEQRQLELECLQHSGIVKKTVYLENLIPVTWEDYVQSTRRRLFEFAPFIDHELVYYNRL